MEIGGYFNLELNDNQNCLHEKAYAFNTGRNALEFILKHYNVKKLHIPYFTCDAIIEPIKKLSIPFNWYKINEKLEIDTNINITGNGEYILYTNYFGIKDVYIRKISNKYVDHLIIDNAQALFSENILNVPTFYSPRKFLGIPDGGYAYLDGSYSYDEIFEKDYSYSRCAHLLKRMELDGNEGYLDFKENSKRLSMQPIKSMSNLTRKLISNVNLNNVKTKRQTNFEYLHSLLGSHNDLVIDSEPGVIPMVYPLLLKDENTRQRLIENKIFVATYWPNVFDWCSENNLEYYLSKYIIPLPIDQRYDLKDMKFILSIINKKHR